MSAKVWNAVWDAVTLPTTTNGTNSQPFSVPKGAKSVGIHVPDLVGVASTVHIEALQPPVSEGVTEVWTAVSVFDLTDGTVEALNAIPESAVTTLPTSALGGGVFRFVASAAQTGSADALTIYLVWGFDN
jgi:hypothetical protein